MKLEKAKEFCLSPEWIIISKTWVMLDVEPTRQNAILFLAGVCLFAPDETLKAITQDKTFLLAAVLLELSRLKSMRDN